MRRAFWRNSGVCSRRLKIDTIPHILLSSFIGFAVCLGVYFGGAFRKESFCSSKIPLLHGKRTTFGKAAFFIRSENKGVPLPRKAEGTRNQKNSHYLRSAHLLVFLTPYIFSCKHSLRARICRVLPLQRVGRHAFRWSCLSVHIIYM